MCKSLFVPVIVALVVLLGKIFYQASAYSETRLLPYYAVRTLLLLDEPFSSLDEVTARELRDEVLRVWRDRTTHPDTFVLVSHLVEEAVLMADRVLVMSSRPGKIIAEVKIDIPRPRFDYVRKDIFFQHVDRIDAILESAGAVNNAAVKH